MVYLDSECPESSSMIEVDSRPQHMTEGTIAVNGQWADLANVDHRKRLSPFPRT